MLPIPNPETDAMAPASRDAKISRKLWLTICSFCATDWDLYSTLSRLAGFEMASLSHRDSDVYSYPFSSNLNYVCRRRVAGRHE